MSHSGAALTKVNNIPYSRSASISAWVGAEGHNGSAGNSTLSTRKGIKGKVKRKKEQKSKKENGRRKKERKRRKGREKRNGRKVI